MLNTCKFKTTNQEFLLFGYYGWKNTGDDVILYALLNEINFLFPNARIIQK